MLDRCAKFFVHTRCAFIESLSTVYVVIDVHVVSQPIKNSTRRCRTKNSN